MAILLDDLRIELRDHLGVDSADLPDPRADLLLNRSYWSLRSKFPFKEKEKSSTTVTVKGTRRYAMPVPFEALRFIALEDPDSKKHKTLDRKTRVWYENEYTNKADAEGEPVGYFREEDDYILFPTPDKVYALVVGFWGIFNNLSGANITPEPPQEWHEILLLGGVWRGFLRFQQFAKARETRLEQIALINSTVPMEAKEEVDSRMSGVDLPEDLTRYP